MPKRYYKFRKSQSKKTDIINEQFWVSFVLYFKRLVSENQFAEKFGVIDEFGWKEGIDETTITDRILEELGVPIDLFEYDTKYDSKPETFDILSIIEFLYTHISERQNSVEDNNGYPLPTDFESGIARYNYTIHINDLFQKYNHPYKLKKGYIKRITSEKLDNYLSNINFKDKKLQEMIDKSYLLFNDLDTNKKDDAMTMIANALERVKTLEGNNKKRSIEEIISNISHNKNLQEDLNELIKLITNISNSYSIRHFEKSKEDIKSINIKNFLYYNYLNVIKLLLSTYDTDVNV